MDHLSAAVPLLTAASSATDVHGHPLSSVRKTFGNIIISIIGAGVLGLPFTFMRSGWLVGVASICGSASLSYFCMMLLVRCRQQLESHGHSAIHTYSDMGKHVFGEWGFAAVDIIVVISQGGCCVAYLIFISENIYSLLPLLARAFLGFHSKAVIVTSLIPFQILLAWVRSLTGLAPFSIFADVANVLAMALVIKDDIGAFQDFSSVKAYTGLSTLPFAFGVAIYCYEGFSMTLPLEASMKDRSKFPSVLALGMLCITLLYVSFGSIGYFAFKDYTQEIITLNLPSHWSTDLVKLGLCIGLFFTFPVMMQPVHEIFERRLCHPGWTSGLDRFSPEIRGLLLKLVRSLVVLVVAYLAIEVPGFATFISLVGSTVCALLAFVLPAAFHLHTFKDEVKWYEKAVDGTLITLGVAFALYGTYQSVSKM